MRLKGILSQMPEPEQLDQRRIVFGGPGSEDRLIDGLCEINPVTRKSTGVPKRFERNEDGTFSPIPIKQGQYQNCIDSEEETLP
jgi:hypothetical protein